MKAIAFYILLPILLTISGEFLLKFSVNQQAISFHWSSLVFMITHPSILLGVGLIIISAMLWIMGMSQFQLSFMYPFLSLNYIIIILGSDFFLKEAVPLNRYVSMGLIIIGLLFISRSQHSKVEDNHVNKHK